MSEARGLQLLIIAACVLVVGPIAYGSGPKRYRGDDVGSHGTNVVVVRVVP